MASFTPVCTPSLTTLTIWTFPTGAQMNGGSVHRDFLLDEETVAILSKEAKRAGLSMSAAVRLLIRKLGDDQIRLV